MVINFVKRKRVKEILVHIVVLLNYVVTTFFNEVRFTSDFSSDFRDVKAKINFILKVISKQVNLVNYIKEVNIVVKNDIFLNLIVKILIIAQTNINFEHFYLKITNFSISICEENNKILIIQLSLSSNTL